MTLSVYFAFAMISGIATRTTELSIFRIHDFRPTAFQRGLKSLLWDGLALSGCVSMATALIHGYVKYGLIVSVVGTVFFYIGYRIGFQATRFGLMSPFCNIITTVLVIKYLL